MTALSIQPTYPTFTDIDGQPLEAGYIWIGTANLNPITNPISVYWDAALTLPATQPIRTIGGYPVNSGTPARLYVNSDYSIQVQNRNGSVVYSAPAATERYGNLITFADITGQLGSDRVNFLQAGTGAVTRTAQAKMRDVVSVKDFGAVGDGVTNDTAAIQAALTWAGAQTTATIYFPRGAYLITSKLSLTGSRVSVVGDGVWASRLQCGIVANPADPMIEALATVDYVAFHGIRFVGNNVSGASGNGHCIALRGTAGSDYTSFVTFRDCEFESFKGNGKDNSGASMLAAAAYLYNVNVVRFDNCVFTACQYGVVIDGTSGSPSTKVHMTGCTWESITKMAVRALFVDEMLIDGLSILNNIGDGGAGVAGVYVNQANSVTITGTRFKAISGGSAVQANQSTNVDQINISDCHFYTSTATPVVDIGTNCQGAVVQGNEFLFDFLVTNGVGMQVSNPAGYIGGTVNVIGNRFRLGGNASLAAAIRLANGTNAVDSFVVLGNYIGQVGAPGTQVIAAAIDLSGAGGSNNALIANNTISLPSPGTVTVGINIATGNGVMLLNNSFRGNVTTQVADSGNRTTRVALGLAAYGGGQSIKKTTITWAVTMNIDASLGNAFIITGTNATPVVIANPSNPVDGQRISFTIRNTSGGAINLSWSSAYKLATWTSPATGNNRSIDFIYDSGSAVWYEIARTPADVPN